MRFGLLYEMETPRPWHALSEYNVYWEALAQIELADRIGIDYVWEVEHHFLEEYSHSSGARGFLWRGHAAHQKYPHRAWRPAAALQVQQSDQARGAGRRARYHEQRPRRPRHRAARPPSQELDGFSVDYDRTRAEECARPLDIIVKAWTDDILEYDGKLIKIPPRRVVPKPIQKPHPPMWMACTAPDSYQMAGDRGTGRAQLQPQLRSGA